VLGATRRLLAITPIFPVRVRHDRFLIIHLLQLLQPLLLLLLLQLRQLQLAEVDGILILGDFEVPPGKRIR
jgi:hypothetical protein